MKMEKKYINRRRWVAFIFIGIPLYMVDRHQLLHRIYGQVCRTMTTKEYEEDTAQCTRCESEVNPATLVAMGDWELCEICVDDI